MPLPDHTPIALPKSLGIPERAIPALLIALSLVPLSPLLVSGTWPVSHEISRYIVLLDGFRDAFLHGILYPRWLPDLFGGYGYPTFCFYQPGFFYAALPFSFLPGYPLVTMYLALLLLFSLGTVGIYKLCAELSGRTVGLLCAALFVLTPYLYVNLYVRGDLSELAAMLLRGGMVDRFCLFIAPRLLGGAGVPVVGGSGWSLRNAPGMRIDATERVGEDVLLTLTPVVEGAGRKR